MGDAAKILRIPFLIIGTSEIQRLVIAGNVLKEYQGWKIVIQSAQSVISIEIEPNLHVISWISLNYNDIMTGNISIFSYMQIQEIQCNESLLSMQFIY